MFLIEFHTYQNQKKITKEFPSVNKEHVLSIKETLLKNVHVYLIDSEKLPRGQYVKSLDFLISININQKCLCVS